MLVKRRAYHITLGLDLLDNNSILVFMVLEVGILKVLHDTINCVIVLKWGVIYSPHCDTHRNGKVDT